MSKTIKTIAIAVLVASSTVMAAETKGLDVKYLSGTVTISDNIARDVTGLKVTGSTDLDENIQLTGWVETLEGEKTKATRAEIGLSASSGMLYVMGGIGLAEIDARSLGPYNTVNTSDTYMKIGGGFRGELTENLEVSGGYNRYIISYQGANELHLGAKLKLIDDTALTLDWSSTSSASGNTNRLDIDRVGAGIAVQF